MTILNGRMDRDSCGAVQNSHRFLCNRKDLVKLMSESPFPLHKRSAVDVYAAIRWFTAQRCCGGAESGSAPLKIEGMRELKRACLLCSVGCVSILF